MLVEPDLKLTMEFKRNMLFSTFLRDLVSVVGPLEMWWPALVSIDALLDALGLDTRGVYRT